MTDNVDMNWPAATEDRVAVAAELPRLVGVALGKSDVFDVVVEVMITEVETIDARLVEPLKAAIDDRRYPELRAFRPVPPPSVADVVRKLERKGARSLPAAKSVGDILLMLFGDPSDRNTCARLAAACRGAMQHVTPHSLVQDVASRRGMGAIRWSEVAALVEHDAILRAQAESDAEHGAAEISETLGLPDPATPRALQIDAWRSIATGLVAEARNLIVGLSGMAAGQASPSYAESLGGHAINLGHHILHGVRVAAEQRIVAKYELKMAIERRKRAALENPVVPPSAEPPPAAAAAPLGHVTIAPIIDSGPKTREISRGHEHILGKPIPLVATPDLADVERTLLREFPHCESVVSMVLREMQRKPFVASRPLLLRGAPGCGKSRFARRLGELLGVGVFRVDGSGDAGVSFAGTERRWYSTEPCRPFLACSRFRQANPMILVDELDKAPQRSDYGRLWDGMLGFLEPETAARFQDPCLQVELDLRHVLYVATANDITGIPGPLLDRFGVLIDFPDPDRSHLPALARHLAEDLAIARGYDPRFVEPFETVELDAMRRTWPGGSVRRLGRIVATVMRARERRERGLPN